MLTIGLCLSKQDTVIDAGKYDGSLGIISAISALKVLNINGRLSELKRPVEVCPLMFLPFNQVDEQKQLMVNNTFTNEHIR